MSEPNVNAWIFLLEDEPSGTSYKTPGSCYQNLIDYGVYNSTDMVSICWVGIVPTSATTIPAGTGADFTVQLQSGTHPDGSTNQQYMDWLIQDARAVNPNIKLQVMLGYGATDITQIFAGPESGWQQAATGFANNLVAYLQHYGLDGFDVDWESPLSDNGTPQQFELLFTAIRQAFNATGKQYYLTLSPAAVGTLDAGTVNSSFDFVNLQLYSGFTCPGEFLAAGVNQDLLAYGAKFEPNSGVPYQTAQQAAAFYAPYCPDQLQYSVFTTWRLNSGNFQYEQAQQMILHQLVNGTPGQSFDDTSIVGAAGNPPISQLVVQAGEVLDAIQATSTGSSAANAGSYQLPQHGGNGGGASTISIASDDPIVTVSGYTGNWFGWQCVLQITLTTQSGVVHGPFGTMANSSSQTPFSYTAPQGESVVAFRGSTVHVPLAGGGSTDIIATLQPVFGATAGSPFFDDTSVIAEAGNPPISQLVVRSGEVLDAIQATNTGANGVVYELPQHGGNGGVAQTINVAAGDSIVTVSGYTGVWYGWNCVPQITLTTQSGTVYGPYGTMGGVDYSTPFSYTAPQGESIVAFRGSTVHVPLAGGGSTDIIATLQPVFGAAPAAAATAQAESSAGVLAGV
ncbi:MAG TPA: glycosyl hydrolase family 18 protein [Longimicrobium sp.]|jgi:hypothetical protein|uniref:jacalin-like lectin n=1 Tax=Longimicrobium sp. TaxID=2029185 RepID=UPI002ED88D3F